MARHLLAALLTLGLALPALSEDPPEAVEAEVTTLPGGVQPDLRGELALSLHDAIAMGIENNLDVEIVRHDPLIAEQEHRIAHGIHDPSLYGTFDYASRETPVASALQASDRLVERETTGSGGVSGLIPKLGWTYDLGFTGRRITTTSSISELSPEYNSALTAKFTAPILKGFLWGQAWTQVKITGLGDEIAQQQFRQQLMDIVGGIENAYWDLAAQKENRTVANKSLETSRALLGQTNAQYEVGVVSRVEVTESEAGVADREFRQIGAENLYLTAQDTLIDSVLGPYLSPSSDLKIVPTDKPEAYTTFKLDREESARKAFEKRPELEIARRQLAQSRISLKFARNQRLPQLDLVGSYGYHGLAGGTNPTPPIFGGGDPQVATVTDLTTGSVVPVSVLDTTPQEQRVRQPVQVGRRFSSADDDYFSADGAKQWTGGARLTIPLGNRAGRGGVSKAELELRKARTSLRRLEQQIVIDVRKSVRNLQSAQLGIEAAERRQVAAEEQHRAEQIRLEHGESTPFDVLQREEDLVEAQSQKIGALQIYHSSVAGLDRAQGTILEDRGVVVEEALPLR
ncbi:MAG: TolC family protein [bacterium]|nr:TolC family protein [bacterium]